MPIEIKDLAEAVGLTIEDGREVTIDQFKDHIGKTYIHRESVLKDDEIKGKITGKLLGSLTTKLAQEFGLAAGELKDKKIEDLFGTVKGKYESQIEELSKKAGQGNDQKVEELTKKLGALEQERLQLVTGRKELEDALNKTKSEFEGSLKSYKLSDKIGKVKSSLDSQFTDDYKADKLKIAGFETTIGSKYQFDLDTEDNVVVKDKDGKIINSKKKVGFPATPDEILIEEADAFGILKKNNAKAKPVFRTPAANNGGGGTEVKIGSKASANAER